MAFQTDDEPQSPINQSYDRGNGTYLNSIKNAEENPEVSESNSTQNDIRNNEGNPANPMNYTGGNKPEEANRPSKRFTFGRKSKGGLIAIIGTALAGIGGIGFFGQALLLPNLSNNSFIKNDSRSTILERRIAKVLERKMVNSGPCDLKKAKCRMGKMPKSMLSAMERKGIVPVTDGNGTPFKYDGNGYVDKNPAGYMIDDGSGAKKFISASSFANEYKNNPVFRKTFKGAYNMRFLGYNGKYMAKNFFSKFKIKRDGGIAADPEFDEPRIGEKLDEKLKSNTETTSESGAKKTFKERIRTLMKRGVDKTKKSGGDPILAVGTTACMAINMPRFISGTYRAIQAAQIMVLASDIIISPAGMLQAGKSKPEAISAIGKLLNDKSISDDGSLGRSALDSKILQKAIGVNKNKVEVSKYAPGYSLLSNPTVRALNSTGDASKTACDAINSPQAAYAVAGIEGAVSAASAGTGAVVIGALKSIGKLAIVMGGVDALFKAAEELHIIEGIANFAYDSAKNMIGNYTEGAKYEELGDALGSGILTFYSSAGLVGGGAPLSKSQVGGFTDVRAEVDNEFRDEDIATLSPLDISSPYTFLGSIASGLSLYSKPDNPILSGVSMISGAIMSPTFIISSVASAATNDAEADCGYAKSFDVDESVAVNSAGYPCVGIPKEYLDMSVDDVANLVDSAIDDESGEPKDDGDITMMMNDCSDGDLESLKGCMITNGSIKDQSYTGNVDNEKRVDKDGDPINVGTIGGYDERKRAAQSIYLFDHQIESILSGEDSESGSDTAVNIEESEPLQTKKIGSDVSQQFIAITDPAQETTTRGLILQKDSRDPINDITRSPSWNDRLYNRLTYVVI